MVKTFINYFNILMVLAVGFAGNASGQDMRPGKQDGTGLRVQSAAKGQLVVGPESETIRLPSGRAVQMNLRKEWGQRQAAFEVRAKLQLLLRADRGAGDSNSLKSELLETFGKHQLSAHFWQNYLEVGESALPSRSGTRFDFGLNSFYGGDVSLLVCQARLSDCLFWAENRYQSYYLACLALGVLNEGLRELCIYFAEAYYESEQSQCWMDYVDCFANGGAP